LTFKEIPFFSAFFSRVEWEDWCYPHVWEWYWSSYQPLCVKANKSVSQNVALLFCWNSPFNSKCLDAIGDQVKRDGEPDWLMRKCIFIWATTSHWAKNKIAQWDTGSSVIYLQRGAISTVYDPLFHMHIICWFVPHFIFWMWRTDDPTKCWKAAVIEKSCERQSLQIVVFTISRALWTLVIQNIRILKAVKSSCVFIK